jgi:hypothetical protein
MDAQQTLDRARANEALKVIKAYALRYHTNPTFANEVAGNEAFQIATGLSVLIDHDPDVSIMIAANLCEDVNYHEAAAYLTAL